MRDYTIYCLQYLDYKSKILKIKISSINNLKTKNTNNSFKLKEGEEI